MIHEQNQIEHHRYRRRLGALRGDLCVCRMQYDSDQPESNHDDESFTGSVNDAVADALITNSTSSGVCIETGAARRLFCL